MRKNDMLFKYFINQNYTFLWNYFLFGVCVWGGWDEEAGPRVGGEEALGVRIYE